MTVKAVLSRQGKRPSCHRSLVATLGLAVVGGIAVTVSPAVGASLALILVFLFALQAPPQYLVLLAATMPWISRPLTEVGLAPRILDFADFVLVPISLVSALLWRFNSSRAHRNTVLLRRLSWCLPLFLLIAVASGLASTTAEPLRPLAGFLFVMEPFLLLVAILLAPPTFRDVRASALVLQALLILQVPFVLFQVSKHGIGDGVQGTQLGAGAGAHQLAGLYFIGSLVAIATLRSRGAAVSLSVVAVICLATDAKQLMVFGPVGLIVFILIEPGLRRAKRLMPLTGVISVSLIALLYLQTTAAFNYLRLTMLTGGGKLGVFRQVLTDMQESPAHSILGLGPGESVSRFAYLTTPTSMRAGSPIDSLGLESAEHTIYYQRLQDAFGYVGTSSFTSGNSSLLGVLGDYGVLGFGLWIVMGAFVISALLRCKSRLSAAAVAGWATAVGLGLVADWLEQPPFLLPLTVLTGVALTSRARWSVDDRPQNATSGA